MDSAQARALYLSHCPPGDRGGVKVEQVDRQALADYIRSGGNKTDDYVASLTEIGKRDDAPLLKLLARHRVNHGEKAAVAAILAAVEACAVVADEFPSQLLVFYDRPGGPPGNGYRDTRPSDIAAAIRAAPPPRTGDA